MSSKTNTTKGGLEEHLLSEVSLGVSGIGYTGTQSTYDNIHSGGISPYDYKAPIANTSDEDAIILLKAVYPYISKLMKDTYSIHTVINILRTRSHIVGYRPVVILLSDINAQLNRLTWE